MRKYWLLGRLSAVILALLSYAAGAGEPDATLKSLMSRINALSTEARYADALAVAEQLRLAAKKSYSEESFEYATALSWMAFLTQTQGRMQEAGPYYEQAAQIFEKVLPADSPHLATSISNLGFYYQMTGKTDEAVRLYERALSMRERVLPTGDPLIADSLNNMATVYKSQGRIKDAENLLRRSLAIRAKSLPDLDPRIAQSLQNLAGVLELEGRLQAAEELLRSARNIRVKSQPGTHPEVAGITAKLAENLYKQREYAKAETLFRQALAIRSKSQPADHPDVAISSEDLARNQLEQGRLDEAEALFSRALAIRQQHYAASQLPMARDYAGLAEIAERQDRKKEALDLIRQASAYESGATEPDEFSRHFLLKHVNFAWALYAKNGSTQLLEESYTTGQRVEHSEAAAALSRMAARVAAHDAKLRGLVRERENLIASQKILDDRYVANLALPPSERKGAADLKREIRQLAERLAEIDAELKQAFPEYFELLKPRPLTISQTAALLHPDEALISFVCGPNETYVWAITKEQSEWHRTEMDPDWLAEAVASLRGELDVEELKRKVTADRGLFNLAIASGLYERLLRPLEGVFGNKRHLLMVPCGPLTSLPFHLLVKSKPTIAAPTILQLAAYRDADWLMRHHAISILPGVGNLRTLRTWSHGTQSRKPLIGFGNPSFAIKGTDGAHAGVEPVSRGLLDTVPSNTGPAPEYGAYWKGAKIDFEALYRALPELPETEEELKLIAQELGVDAKALRFGAQASESAVKQSDLSQYRIVYFATHGLIAGEVKGVGEPALVLARPAVSSELDDGILTASEVSQLSLDADWVVLAACNTASPKGPGAAALSGLAKAFFYAGSRSLLVSHWRVGSQTAVRITTTAFEMQSRDASLSRAEALRRSMLSIALDPSDPWNAYPAFWAPFEIVGEGGQ